LKLGNVVTEKTGSGGEHGADRIQHVYFAWYVAWKGVKKGRHSLGVVLKAITLVNQCLIHGVPLSRTGKALTPYLSLTG